MKLSQAKILLTGKYSTEFKAWVDGKDVQFKNRAGEWESIKYWNFQDFPNTEVRIKPEAKLRPWTADEVPVGAQIAWNKRYSERSLIIGIAIEGIQHFGYSKCTNQSLRDCLENAEHSTDNGKTWKPCGVLIND